MNKISATLVGTDFSEDSKAALAHGIRTAQRSRTRLHVMHVIEHFSVFIHTEFGALDLYALKIERMK